MRHWCKFKVSHMVWYGVLINLIWRSLFTIQFFLRYHDLNLECSFSKIVLNQIWFNDHNAFDWSATN